MIKGTNAGIRVGTSTDVEGDITATAFANGKNIPQVGGKGKFTLNNGITVYADITSVKTISRRWWQNLIDRLRRRVLIELKMKQIAIVCGSILGETE